MTFDDGSPLTAETVAAVLRAANAGWRVSAVADAVVIELATPDSDVPAGMVAEKIPSGKFAVFTTEKGPAQKVVPKTWMTINSLPKTDVGGDRVYQADYEIYDERAADPTNMVADIYVGIR